MSLFNFTRQEQITILFLAFALIVGGVITLVKRHHPHFAPELVLEERTGSNGLDTTQRKQEDPPSALSENLLERKIDINRAPVEELMTLPGIGPKTAHLIVAFREEHGKFRTLEDLKGVKGIGNRTVKRLEPFVKIE